MAAPNSSVLAADPIHRSAAPAPNSSAFTADPVHQAAVGASPGMSGAPGAPPIQQVALMARMPFPPGPPSMRAPPPSRVAPPRMAPQPPQAGAMTARLPLPAGHPMPNRRRPAYFDMPFGPQMTGYEKQMTGFDKSVRVPYGPYIHNAMPSGGSYERTLPSNASNTLHVEGLPTNCTRRELKHIFRRFTGFCDVRLVNRGFNNVHLIAFVDFDTPAQAFSAMESLQGYMFDVDDPYMRKLHLQFSPPGPRSGDGPRSRL